MAATAVYAIPGNARSSAAPTAAFIASLAFSRWPSANRLTSLGSVNVMLLYPMVAQRSVGRHDASNFGPHFRLVALAGEQAEAGQRNAPPFEIRLPSLAHARDVSELRRPSIRGRGACRVRR